MAVKPQNCVPVIKDKVVNKFLDLSAGAAIAGGTGLVFIDPDNDYEIVEAKFTTTVTLTSTSTTVILGTVADDNHFVESVNLAATAGNRVVGVTQSLTLTGTKKLLAGKHLVLLSTGTGNTGEGLFTIVLRPLEKARGNATKRPQNASATS